MLWETLSLLLFNLSSASCLLALKSAKHLFMCAVMVNLKQQLILNPYNFAFAALIFNYSLGLLIIVIVFKLT